MSTISTTHHKQLSIDVFTNNYFMILGNFPEKVSLDTTFFEKTVNLKAVAVLKLAVSSEKYFPGTL